ncbi:MAG TPA: hypothetical protein VFC65_14010 [Prolixibacteraceae bacterium]|nr:hypothetical protein [Prolixibacteraceae bacterium]
MKGKWILFLFLMSVGVSYGQGSWKKTGIKLPPPVCYASPESHKSFIGPPQNLKAGTLNNVVITVGYVGFSDNAKQAFQYAIDIWETLIYSPIPIRVQATWTSLESNVLGSCAPTNFYTDFNSSQIWNCYYPIALVEKCWESRSMRLMVMKSPLTSIVILRIGISGLMETLPPISTILFR